MFYAFTIISFALLSFFNFSLNSQEKISCSSEFEKSKKSHAYLYSREALAEEPFQFSCLRIFFLLEPSLEILKSYLAQTEQNLSPQENYELHAIALEKAMAARNVELGLEWGKKIYQAWKDKEESHKSIYTYAFFLYASEDYTASKDVLNWLSSRTHQKSLLKKIRILSKQLEVP